MGQNIRKLVIDGVLSQNVYGIDMEPLSIERSYDLFLDREKLGTTFIVGDILNPTVDLQALMGKMDVINVSSVLHLFNWDEQLKVAEQL